MEDPFRRISPFQRDEEEPVEQLPDFIKVRCLKCDEMCVRSDVNREWVHETEVVSLGGLLTGTHLSTHSADPDIIDVEVIE